MKKLISKSFSFFSFFLCTTFFCASSFCAICFYAVPLSAQDKNPLDPKAQKTDVLNQANQPQVGLVVEPFEDASKYLKSLSGKLSSDSEFNDIINTVNLIKNGAKTFTSGRENDEDLSTLSFEDIVTWNQSLNDHIKEVEKLTSKVSTKLSEITEYREEIKLKKTALQNSVNFLNADKTSSKNSSELLEQLKTAEKTFQTELDELLIAQNDLAKITSKLTKLSERSENILNSTRNQILFQDAKPLFSFFKDPLCKNDCSEIYSSINETIKYINNNLKLILTTIFLILLFLLLIKTLPFNLKKFLNFEILVSIIAFLVCLFYPMSPLILRISLWGLLIIFISKTYGRITDSYVANHSNQWSWLPIAFYITTSFNSLISEFGLSNSYQYLLKAGVLFLSLSYLYRSLKILRSTNDTFYSRFNAALITTVIVGVVFALIGILFGYQSAGDTFISCLLSISLSSIITFFAFKFIQKVFSKSFVKDTRVLHSNIFLSLVALFCYLMVFSTGLSSLGFEKITHDTISSFLNYNFTLNNFAFSVKTLLYFIASIFLGIKISGASRNFLSNQFFRELKMSAGASHTLSTSIYYVLLLISALIALSTLGLSLQNFAIVAGALSLGAGFGLQQIVNNITSGLILLFERPIKPGDLVIINGTTGTITKMGLRSTTIKTVDEAEVIIPNSKLVSEQVTNYTYSSNIGKASASVRVSTENDLDKVIKTLRAAAYKTPGLLLTPQPDVTFKGVSEFGYEFSVSGNISDVQKKASIDNELLKNIFNDFKTEGIILAFPRRDITLNNK